MPSTLGSLTTNRQRHSCDGGTYAMAHLDLTALILSRLPALADRQHTCA